MILPSNSQRYLWDGFWNLQDMSGWYLQLEVQNLLSKIRVAWNRWFPEIGVAPTHSFSWDFHRIFPNKDHPAIGVPPLMETLRSAQITVQDHDYHDIYIYITIQIIMYHYAIYIYDNKSHANYCPDYRVYYIGYVSDVPSHSNIDPPLTTIFFLVAHQQKKWIVGEQSNFHWCCNHTYVSGALSKSKSQLNK